MAAAATAAAAAAATMMILGGSCAGAEQRERRHADKKLLHVLSPCRRTESPGGLTFSSARRTCKIAPEPELNVFIMFACPAVHHRTTRKKPRKTQLPGPLFG
jgi:hypothetical protein